MSMPMHDIPEHLPIEVDKDGHGPVPIEKADRTICWCSAGDNCTVVPPSYRKVAEYTVDREVRERLIMQDTQRIIDTAMEE